MDCLYPGSFPFSRIKWGAKHEHEFVENYKVLQSAFAKNGIKRHIDVAKLVKAKYQDNLEFCQWIKAYFEKHYTGEAYDALGRRKGQDLFYIAGGGKVAPLKPQHSASSVRQPVTTTASVQKPIQKAFSGYLNSSTAELLEAQNQNA